MTRTIHHALTFTALLCAVVTLLCTAATPALATPSLGVTLERDSAAFPTVSHSDERVDYTVKVKNTAPVLVGDSLDCVRGGWDEGGAPNFTYQWLRNGTPIAAATNNAYATSVADAGKAIQCQVTATNTVPDVSEAGVFLGSTRISPALVPDPQPATDLPVPPASVAKPESTEPLEGKVSSELTCDAGSWINNPNQFTYQWYRNGVAFGSPTTTAATSVQLTLTAAEQKPASAFQCEIIGSNSAGAVAKVSDNLSTSLTNPGPVPGPPDNKGTLAAEVIAPSANETSGTVELELELPGGMGTFAFKTEGSGWSCTTSPALVGQNAKISCSRSDALTTDAEYPELTVITALGADIPDVGLAKATVFGGGAPMSASDQLAFLVEPPIPFGLEKFNAKLVDKKGDDYRQAGGHAFAGVSETALTRKRSLVPENPSVPYAPIGHVRQVVVEVPRGVVGNVLALPELCPSVEDVKDGSCPPGSVVGGIRIVLSDIPPPGVNEAIYAIEPEFGVPAQFAFVDPSNNLYTFAPRLRADDGYAVDFELAPAPEVNVLEATVTLCDFGGNKTGATTFTGCKEKDDPSANPKPLFTNPTRCEAQLVTRARLNSWEDPDTFVEAPPFPNATITGCEAVPFEPQIKLTPTSKQADSPTGMEVEVSMPTDGLEDPDGIAQASLRKAEVTFPEGMAVNPSAGQGLGACSAEQVKLKTNDPISCPDSSKIGSVEIDTPVLADTLKGDVYIAKQGEVEGSLIGFYLVFDSPKNGILVKLPAKVTPDPATGRLTVTVDESPEQPFSAVRMKFPGGPKATLLTPPECGTYEIEAELTPWSGGDPVVQTSSFQVSEGPNGGPCPNGALEPQLRAGTQSSLAAKTGPFVLRLTREDGSDRFIGLNLTTPPGLTAYLKGIPYCPDATLASISPSLGTGQAQIESPSCPAASQIGVAIAGAGGGPEPFYAETGRAYLAGPYKGAPLSIAVVAPAVAGPLDLGSVVIRNALFLNPRTAQVTVKSDPIPTILHGLLLDIRDIRIAIDRPSFILNPTSCAPMAIAATVKGESGASASLSRPFQAEGCERLAFKPKLGIRLIGGTRRGSHPALRGTLEAKPGEANISQAVVTIPRSEFLDQAHIRTICTRVQFAAKACPEGSVYGHAAATTPLLDYPVEGPVYLRSSDHKLPDLVVALHGPAWQPIEALVVGRIDSIKGQIRSTFEAAPDVPLTKFTLSMQGGRKGLLVNSRDICSRAFRAKVALTGHNGMTSSSRPAVRNGKCDAKRGSKRKRRLG